MSAVTCVPLSRLSTDIRSPDHIVCQGLDSRLSWGEFTDRVAGLTNALKRQKLRSAIVACIRPETFLVALFALWRSECVAVIPPNHLPETLDGLGQDNGPILDDGLVAELDQDRPPCRSSRHMSGVNPASAHLVLYTSGSSGTPKRIAKTLGQIEAEIAMLESVWGHAVAGSTVLSTVPHHHLYGLLFRLLWPLSMGRVFDAIVCTNPEQLRERIALHPQHIMVSSPAHLGRFPLLMDLGNWQPRPRLIFSSGAPLTMEAAAAYRASFGVAPTEVFGSTETGGVAWRQQTADTDGDAWIPLPGIQVERAADGCLVLDSPFLPVRDWHMDDAITLLADGRFRLEGRTDRIVKLEGKRLALPEMENRLRQHAWIDNAAVAMLPEGGRLGAAVVLNASGQAALDSTGRSCVRQSLRGYLGKSFESVFIPRRFRFVADLPFTDRGKLSVDVVQALFGSHDEPDA